MFVLRKCFLMERVRTLGIAHHCAPQYSCEVWFLNGMSSREPILMSSILVFTVKPLPSVLHSTDFFCKHIWLLYMDLFFHTIKK